MKIFYIISSGRTYRVLLTNAISGGSMTELKTRIAVVLDVTFSSLQDSVRIGISRYLNENGIEAVSFGVSPANVDNAADRGRLRFFDFIRPEHFDGVLALTLTLVNAGGRDTVAQKFNSLKPLPIVSMGPSLTGEDAVNFENTSGMNQIVRHLVDDHGYREFAYISGPLLNDEMRIRLDSFKSTLLSYDIKIDDAAIYEGDFLPPSGSRGVAVLFDERKLRPRALVCANDLMALGAWKALKDRGFDVPGDVAITGYDDSKLLNMISHNFTTVRQPFDELGYIAASRLHSLIKQEKLNEFIQVKTGLVIRSSCGCNHFSKKDCDKGGYESLLSDINSLIKSNASENSIGRAWVDVIYKLLNDDIPQCDPEILLRHLYRRNPAGKEDDRRDLYLMLHTMMLEQLGQMTFVRHWHDYFQSMNLRVAIDNLQDALNRDLSFSPNSDKLAAVARSCESSDFYLYRFVDSSKNLNHVNLEFEMSGGRVPAYHKEESQTPLPPRGSGTLTANMLSDGDILYGYMLVGTDGPSAIGFDNMRIRFSSLMKDLAAITRTRELNRDLLYEISERTSTEQKLKEALVLVEQMSIEDELTRLRNRRGFFALAEQQVLFLRRDSSPFFVMYADLDDLKMINDQWGHNEGDLALQSAADVLRSVLRASDIAARLGGDEFSAIISKANPPHFDSIRKRIQTACEHKNSQLGRAWRLSMSIGHFYSDNDCTLDIKNMLELADAELYKEKMKRKQTRN